MSMLESAVNDTLLMLRLHLPRSSYFSVCDFPYDFRHRRLWWATTYVFTIHKGVLLFLALASVGDRGEIVGYPHVLSGNQGPCDVREKCLRFMSPCGLPMIAVRFLSQNYH